MSEDSRRHLQPNPWGVLQQRKESDFDDRRGTRSSREIRDGLAVRRAQIERDFKTLGVRFEEATNVRSLVKRHPVLAVTAGSLLGVLLVRRPAFLVAAARRAATWGVPLLVSAVSQRLARR